MPTVMTVEQILAAAQYFSIPDKIRLIAWLSTEVEQALNAAMPAANKPPEQSLTTDAMPASSLLELAGTWSGDDFEACLQIVCETRSPVRFIPSATTLTPPV